MTPQLQELLEFMADDEKVFMIKGSNLQAMAQIMQIAVEMKHNYQEMLQDLTSSTQEIRTEIDRIKESQKNNLAELKSLKSVSNTLPTLSGHKVPTSSLINKTPVSKRKVANIADNTGLADLLEDFSKKKETPLQEKIPTNQGETSDNDLFNNYFSTIYILNMNNRGSNLAEQLKTLGIVNCQIIDSDLPKRVKPDQKYMHYMRDVLEDAIESSHQRILVSR